MGRAPAQRPDLDLLARPRAAGRKRRPTSARAQALQLLEGIASVRGFYEQLALEELGQRITVPAEPDAPDARKKRTTPAKPRPDPRAVCHPHWAAYRGRARVELHHQPARARRHGRPQPAGRRRPGLPQRGLGPLHQHQRTHQGVIDLEQRFPMPFKAAVVARAKPDWPGPGLCVRPDPPGKPLHHGRQIGRGRLGPDAGHAGHRRWTAKKIGLTRFPAAPDHRPRHQHRHRHRLPQAGARQL